VLILPEPGIILYPDTGLSQKNRRL